MASRGIKVCAHENGSFSKGYAINHARREILFQPRPEDLIAAPYEGCFVSFTVLATEGHAVEIVCRNDIFGQLPILYTSLPGEVIAFSDSVLALAELRKSLGLTNSLDEPAFLARSGKNGFCDQLLSSRTFVQQIRYALPGAGLTVGLRDGQPVLTVLHEGALNRFAADDIAYEDGVRQAAAAMVGVMGGLLAMDGPRVRHDVSGGQDSRLSLAASIASGGDRDRLILKSSPAMPKDLAVAQQIGTFLGLPVNPGKKGTDAPAPKQLSAPGTWFAASAGIYDPLYAMTHLQKDVGSLVIGGHGAEVYKGNFGWRSVHRIATWVGGPHSDAISLEARRGLKDFGIAPWSAVGSEWSYLAFRGAIHSGRFTTGTVFGMRPILNRQLVGVAHRRVAETGPPAKGGDSVISDLLIHISPELAALPFDSPAKTLDAARIAGRLAVLGRLGATLPDTAPYTVTGTPDGQVCGPLPGVMDFAAARGFAGNFTPAGVRARVAEARDIAPAGVRALVEAMAGLVEAEMGAKVSATSKAGRFAGKLMALHLLT